MRCLRLVGASAALSLVLALGAPVVVPMAADGVSNGFVSVAWAGGDKGDKGVKSASASDNGGEPGNNENPEEDGFFQSPGTANPGQTTGLDDDIHE